VCSEDRRISAPYFAFSNEEPLIPGIHPGGWALYEYRNGVLSYAGRLPDGSVDPGGAKGIAFASEGSGLYSPAANGNQVSQDGSRLFFTSSSPEELYVHETEADGAQRTVLASQSQLPGHMGEPAPSGVVSMAATAPGAKELNPERHPYGINFTFNESRFTPLYGYASPDGSYVFFKSGVRLTVEAPEGGGMYDFNVDTGVLEYVAAPGLAGIATVADDGSSFVFENNAVSPTELDHWSAGPHGGTVSKIVQLPPLTDPYGGEWCDGVSCVGPAHLVDHNSVLVFAAEAPIPGFNDAGEFMQIFRYDFTTNELSCLSCPPAGIKPSGTPELSPIDEALGGKPGQLSSVNDNRGVSADGSRVFFDSPDPLVPRAVNGERNVYEWENGSLFLVSSGTSASNSLFLDTSESGGDVFFTTTDELVQGDNDMAYDVYDTRIPRPGDNPPPASLPCQGDVCQGPPSTPSLLGLPASATFNGLGNAPPPVSDNAVSKAKAKAKVKTKGRKRKRKRKRAKTGRHAQRANHGRGK
jgi:hypothetical protein